MISNIEGPAWDLSSEYPAADSPEMDADLTALESILDELAALTAGLEQHGPVPLAQKIFKQLEQAGMLLQNTLTYANCLLSVDGHDQAALALQGRLQSFQTRYADLQDALSQFTNLAEERVIDEFLADADVQPAAFQVRHARKRRHALLDLEQEQLINGLSQDGLHAWGKLYDQLSGTASCEVLVGNEVQTMGLAEAAGLLQAPQATTRENAWRGINAAWQMHRESCAASINAIAGWRLEVIRKRSTRQAVDFLEEPLHMNRISRETLETLLQVAEAARPMAQRAARLQARACGRPAMGPWDQRAPAPKLVEDATEGMAFDAAVDAIAGAYGAVHPSMGDFVRMVAGNLWIEGRVGGNKRPGAYCTTFARSRTPRVYMTYTGGAGDIITLAHELGHALHSWVMRDLPECQRRYGMSLAETASTFGETLVRDALVDSATDMQQRLDMAWEEMSALVAFLLNIPVRFEFEKRFYEARRGRPLLADELDGLMSDAWMAWYGDTLVEPDPMFWASKLHFYISEISFYNFPYLFGYLFSLGVYARRAEDAYFYRRYEGLLQDTGRMTAEALAARHLGVDLTQPQFWQDTLTALALRVDAFEGLLDELEA